MAMAKVAAKAAKTWTTRDEWNARALELAEAKHTRGTARYLGGEEQTARGHVWRVPSRTTDGEYKVLVSGELAECPCPSGVWGRPCSHAGAALHADRQRQAEARETGPSEAWAWWMNGGEW